MNCKTICFKSTGSTNDVLKEYALNGFILPDDEPNIDRIASVCPVNLSGGFDNEPTCATEPTPYLLAVSDSQTGGRGRRGRSFFSPEGGLYMSLLLTSSSSARKAASMPPNGCSHTEKSALIGSDFKAGNPRDAGILAEQALRLTPAAAVFLCHAIEKAALSFPESARPAWCPNPAATAQSPLKIKWVNDLYLSGLKVAGILTEALPLEDGSTSYIVGMGLNLYFEEADLPAELKGIAGHLGFPREDALRSCAEDGENLKLSIASCAASALIEFWERSTASNTDDPWASVLAEYRKRSLLIGREILVLPSRPAFALGIDDEARLLVRYEGGTEEALFSGEVGIRPLSGPSV